MKIRVGVIFGGRSGEHEISIRSARTVIEQIDRSKYEVVPIAIDKAGVWLNPAESAALLPATTGELVDEAVRGTENAQVAIVGDPKYRGLTRMGSQNGSATLSALDVVFPVMHGTYGEDGTIQGLLEMANIPYIGCGVLSSACGMDKTVMKVLFKDAGLPICRHEWLLRSAWEMDRHGALDRLEKAIGYPVFVKPANLGSSVGVSRAIDRESLAAAIDLAAQYDRKIIVEEALEMREIECAVIGNDEPEASLPGEYLIRDETKAFLDYTEKYKGTGNNEFVVPAALNDELTERIREMAVRAFKAVEGSGLARVDFFLRRDNDELLINEINTMPGLTDASGFPKMWAGTGISFSQVVDRLVELAFERHRDKSRNKTTLDA
jgi:D-alanine-D-alanine ligase